MVQARDNNMLEAPTPASTLTRDPTPSTNPFDMLLPELEHELEVRRARWDYYTYVQMSNIGFKATRFHDFLCKKVQDFIEADTGHAYDYLLLSVPPQHGKSLSITETLPS